MNENFKNLGSGLIELDHNQFIQAPEVYKQQHADQWLDLVLSTDATDDNQIKNLTDKLYQIGQSEQHAFWELNTRLKQPLEKLIRDTESNGKVTLWFRELQQNVLKIKPPKPSFMRGFIDRFKLLFSLKESTWEIWLEAYPLHKQQILKVTEQLAAHKKKLTRDNSMLLTDKKALESQMLKLEHSFDVICYFEKKVSQEVLHIHELNKDTKQILTDEWLPAIQQRLIELQQQLLIARQSVMTMDLFIRQNESEKRGIDQAVYTTMNAIEVTASIFVLKQAKELNEKVNNPVNNGTVDAQKLKQARRIIDQALSDMEQANSVAKNNLPSTNSEKY